MLMSRFCGMPKAKKTKTKKLPKKLMLPNDEPVHLDMSFQDAIKLALNTPLQKDKKAK